MRLLAVTSPLLPPKGLRNALGYQNDCWPHALPNGKSERFYWDDELKGFGFRLRQRAGRLHRTMIAQYRANGRTRRPTLGTAEVLLAPEARAAARKVLAGVALGGDPQRGAEAKRQAQAHTLRPRPQRISKRASRSFGRPRIVPPTCT